MLKKILASVGTVVAGFILVVVVVIWQVRHISAIIRIESDTVVPFYRASAVSSEHTLSLERAVGGAFLAGSESDLDAAAATALEVSKKLGSSVQFLKTPRFAELHRSSLTNAILRSGTNSATGISGMRSIGDLVNSLAEEYQTLNSAAERTLALAREQLLTRKKLSNEREELSKVYRQSFPLQSVDEKSFALASRAVINVLYSSSTRDLNFVGRSKFKEALSAYAKVALNDEQKKILDGLKLQFDRTLETALAASASSADYAYFLQNAASLKMHVELLRSQTESKLDLGQRELANNAASTTRTILWLSILSILIGTALAVRMARSIATSLAAIVSRLHEGAQQVTTTSSQLSSASANMADGASRQASSLEETSAALEEMSGTTKQNASNADKAKQLASEARAAADAGVREVEELIAAMDEMKSSSNSIAKIIKTIDEIAFQTNILALNAAVEAARAGEAGLGFAVVAEEVRSLAQRCASAAQETSQKIADSIQKSGRGADISGKVSLRLHEIVQKSRGVDELVVHIAHSSSEQSLGIGQLTQAVLSIDQITQAGAGTASQTSEAASALQSQADELHQTVATLLQIVRGTTAGGSASSLASKAPENIVPHPARNSGVTGPGRAAA